MLGAEIGKLMYSQDICGGSSLRSSEVPIIVRFLLNSNVLYRVSNSI